MKICRVCKTNKELDEFYKKTRGAQGVGTRCKSCKKDYDIAHNNKPESKELKKVYNAKPENKEKRKEWERANPNKIIEKNKKWLQNNRHIASARDARRRASKLNQTPNLTDEEKQRIRDIYKECQTISKSTGISHHVDHIKSLAKGGLHHPDNLQILTAIENLKKG